MPLRIAFLLLLSLGVGLPTRGAAPPRREIVVHGSGVACRRVVERASRAWLAQASDRKDLEGLLTAVGTALVQEGWGEGEVEAGIDSLDGAIVYAVGLRGVRRSVLRLWEWDPQSDRYTPPAGVWIPDEREQQLDRILQDVRREGYPFASIQILEVDGSADSLAVRASLSEGPQLMLAGVGFEGVGGTRASHLERVSGLHKGEPIRPDESLRARDRLERTGLFAEVHGPWLRPAGEGNGVLVYRMVALPHNRAEGALGYDGASRTLSGFVHMELGNLFGTGRRFNVSWDRLDRDRSRLDLSYREPFVAGLPIAAVGSLSQSLEDSTWTRDEGAVSLQGDLGGGWFARLGAGKQRIVFSGEPRSRSERLTTLVGLGADGRSESGTRGARFSFDVDTGSLRRSPQSEVAEGRLIKVRTDGEYNLLFRSAGHVRCAWEAGWIEGPDSLPRPEAFGLGGGSTLRGFAEEQFRVLRYDLLRIEGGIRLLPEGNRIYLFLDRAAFHGWPDSRRSQKTGFGVGVRVRAATGWVLVDYGVSSGEPVTSGRIHFRLETRF